MNPGDRYRPGSAVRFSVPAHERTCSPECPLCDTDRLLLDRPVRHRAAPRRHVASVAAGAAMILVALFALIVIMFLAATETPAGTVPGRGVWTTPEPGPSGGVATR